ncbi:hypothetical protein [Micromonospora sp. NBC_00858]|nr:hypothetical protein OG990_26305 [Micromonospora sp. NBC_00858]
MLVSGVRLLHPEDAVLRATAAMVAGSPEEYGAGGGWTWISAA